MNDPFWDSFTVEMSQFVDQVEVLKEYWAVFTSYEGVLVVINGRALGISQSVTGVVSHREGWIGFLNFCFFLNF